MSIRDWPRSERPREKLLDHGPSHLSDAELLAIFVGSGVRGQSAIQVSEALLSQFGSLREFLNADPNHAMSQQGLGPARYVMLQAALELTRRHYRDSLRIGPDLLNPDVTQAFLRAQLRDRPYEVFCCLHLDAHLRLIAFEELFRGSVEGATVHAREVVRRAISNNTTAMIVAHNHPSGAAVPSRLDEHVTQELHDALNLIDVKLLDHIVVGADGVCVSFAERGIL